MSEISIVAGSFSSFFVGLVSASGTTPMSQINQIGTGGYQIKYTQPRSRWLRCVNRYIPDRLPSIEISCAFITDDPNAWYIGMSNWLTDYEDTPPKGNQYALFLYDSVNDGSSVFIPICEVDINMILGRQKDKQTTMPLKFQWTSPLGSQLFYKRTNAALKTIMGAQSPI
jgi:hypothetical protein